MSVYEDYLKALVPHHYMRLASPNVDTEASYPDEFGGTNETLTGGKTERGQGDNLIVEDDPIDTSTGFGEDNYMGVFWGDSLAYASFSINCLVQLNSITSSYNHVIFSCGRSGTLYTLFVRDGILCFNSDDWAGTSVDDFEIYSDSYKIEVGGIYHITSTFELAGGQALVSLYINGVFVGSTTIGLSHRSLYYFGRSSSSSSTEKSFFTQVGAEINYMSHLSFYNRVLTGFEISKLAFLARYNAEPVLMSGTITANLTSNEFNVYANRLSDGKNLGFTTTANNTFEFYVPQDEYMVTVAPNYGNSWSSEFIVSLGEKVVPTNSDIQYYFECTTAGTTGTTEPVWQVGAFDTTTDGTAVWTLVDRIVQPITYAPVRGLEQTPF